MKNCKLAIVLLTLMGSGAAFADPFLEVNCHTLDKKPIPIVALSVGPGCLNKFKIYVSEINQTCTNNEASFVYTEGAAAGDTVIVSAGNQSGESMHLISSGHINIATIDKSNQKLSLTFAAKLTHSSLVDGKKVVEKDDVACTGTSFEDP